MELFNHQKEGIRLLKEKNRAILADSMGLGKSRQAIVAAKESNASGILIVCPASLKINWEREIKIVYPDAKVSIIDKKKEIDVNQEWTIINYDILEREIEKIEDMVSKEKIDTLILDEAHYIKGDSIRAKAIIGGRKKKKSGEIVKFDGISKKMNIVWCLSGTPILNRPIELFNILKAINHPLAQSKEKYAEKYCGRFWMYRIFDGYRRMTIPSSVYYQKFNRPGVKIECRWPDDTGSSNLEELRDQIKDYMIRRKKEDVLDLPEKIISTKEFEINDEWKKEYDNAFDNYIEFMRENPIDDWNEENVLMSRQLVEVQKLKQVCSLAKVDTIVEDINEAVDQGEKVIVFSQYTETIKTLEVKLRNLGVRTLTGEDKMEVRQKAIDDFQNNDKIKIFISNIKAGGVGINLTKASIVMFADMEWSPEIHNQAMDRAHRIGQTGTVNVYYYIAKGTIEEDIMEVLESKKEIMDQILEGKRDKVKTSSIFGLVVKRIVDKNT